jgi:cell division protein FtsL
VEAQALMATKNRRIGKRSLIAIGLVSFVAVTFIVVWRRSLGVENSRQIARMETRIRELETERKTLQNRIREASSYNRVVTEAQKRLDMKHPDDSRIRYFDRDSRATRDTTGSE